MFIRSSPFYSYKFRAQDNTKHNMVSFFSNVGKEIDYLTQLFFFLFYLYYKLFNKIIIIIIIYTIRVRMSDNKILENIMYERIV